MFKQFIKSIRNTVINGRSPQTVSALSLSTQSRTVITSSIEITRLTLADGKEIDFKHRENAIAWIIINASIGQPTPTNIQTIRTPYLEVM